MNWNQLTHVLNLVINCTEISPIESLMVIIKILLFSVIIPIQSSTVIIQIQSSTEIIQIQSATEIIQIQSSTEIIQIQSANCSQLTACCPQAVNPPACTSALTLPGTGTALARDNTNPSAKTTGVITTSPPSLLDKCNSQIDNYLSKGNYIKITLTFRRLDPN